MSVFSLSVEEDPSGPTDSAFPSFLYCKGCGQLLGDSPLGAGLDLGQGLDLGAGLYCLTCEEGIQSDPRQDVFGGGGGHVGALITVGGDDDDDNDDEDRPKRRVRERRKNGGANGEACDAPQKVY
ncbi:hypothetical protein CRUP_031659, partial [Coryphaenoides rupestris]